MVFFRKEKSPGLNVVPEKKPGKKRGGFFSFRSKRKDVQPLEVVGKAVAEPEEKVSSGSAVVHFLQIPVIFMLGGPGSGKGTQCAKLLETHKDLAYTSVGDLLRASENEDFKQKMKEGALVSIEDILDLLRKWILETITTEHRAIILDGFPREVEQCEVFENEFGKDAILGCLFYEASDEVLLQRLQGRATSSDREDDNPETMKKRLEVFHAKTEEVKKFFETSGRLTVVDAEKDVEEVFKDTALAVESWLEAVAVNALADAEVCFVLGGPGSGKGTQCDKLKSLYPVTHLSTGDVLRGEVSGKTWIGRQCESIMSSGEMVPDAVLLHLVKQRMKACVKDGKSRFLLDGFPRKLVQAESFDTDLVPVQFVIFYECPGEILKQRLLKRGQSSGRADDNEETIKTRVEVFERETVPVAERYSKLDKLIRIPADRSVDEIFEETKSGVGNYWKLQNNDEHTEKAPAEIEDSSSTG